MRSAHPLRAARDQAGLSLRRRAARDKVHYTRIHYAEHGLDLWEDELAYRGNPPSVARLTAAAIHGGGVVMKLELPEKAS